MWFKNLGVYTVKNLNTDDLELNKRAESQAFVPCKPHQEASFGWVTPFGADSMIYAPGANGSICLAVQFERRPVSSSQIKMMVDQEIAKLKKDDPSFKATSKLIKSMKEDIKAELQPTATSNVNTIHGFVHLKSGRMYIDGTPSKCEKFIGAFQLLFADQSDSVEIEALQTEYLPEDVMTSWLIGPSSDEDDDDRGYDLPDSLVVGDAFTLKDSVDRSEINYKKADPVTDVVLKDYLNCSKKIEKMKVEFEEDTEFYISNDFHISGIKWGSDLKIEADSNYEEVEDVTSDDEGSAIFGTMANASINLVNFLVDTCFGGECEETEVQDAK